MRLSPLERSAILEETRAKDRNAVIYLYGSRTDDHLKGGDIDLLVVSEKLGYMDKIDLGIAIKGRLGEQKLDLKIIKPADAERDACVQSILPTALPLEP